MEKTERNVGLDLLRILAMIMIVTLHYLGKGGLIQENNSTTINLVLIQFLEALSLVAVNCYVLISGYFLTESEFKIKKILNLWLEVIFYSVTIYIILIFSGLIKFNIKDMFKAILPITTKQYWFVNVYFAMYIFSPYINKLIKNLSKEELKKLMIICIVLFSILSILPQKMTINEAGGTGIIWFITLYIIAAYIRLYWEKKINSKWLISTYLLMAVVIVVGYFIAKLVGNKIGNPNLLIQFQGWSIDYSNTINLIESVALFLLFLNLPIQSKFVKEFAKIIAPLTFGVYVIHENPALKSILYDKILHTEICYNNNYEIFIAIISILAIFWICIGIEFIRKKLFNKFNIKI